MLARLQAAQDIAAMAIVPGGDEHRIDGGITQNVILAAGTELKAVAISRGAGARSGSGQNASQSYIWANRNVGEKVALCVGTCAYKGNAQGGR